MLTGGLKGRLEPEEWRPLLASSLIYEAKLKLKKTLGIVATAVASIILGLAVITLFALLDPKGAVYFVIPAFLGSVVWLLFGIPFRFEADRLATQLVGKEPLIHVLEKINGMELEDKDVGGRLARRPSLEERIENLRPL
jgi:Zn-dependent protease with chaperone function